MKIKLQLATTERTHAGCITRFSDGATVDAIPHPLDPHYSVIAHRCGYGDDLHAYCFEHEVCHEFLSEKLRNAPSMVLWALAHGDEVSPATAAFEEIAVQSFQRWLRANEQPIIGGVDWFGLKAEALELLGISC